jgi:hypothetical protein
MLRIAIVILLLGSTAYAEDDAPEPCACDVTAAACDAACACDLECENDWSKDECAEPGAGCLPEMTDAQLDAAELEAEEIEPIEWRIGDVQCPEGSTNTDGVCAPASLDVTGGCDAGGATGLIVVLAILVLARRRRLWPVIIIACSVDGATWDSAVDDGPTGDAETYRDVFAADLGDGDGAQYLLANQPLVAGAQEPVAEFALAATKGGVPILRVTSRCGDRLQSGGDGELLGWARSDAGDGTAALVELVAPDGCFAYETDDEAITTRLSEGYAVTQTLGYVWPPGLGDEPLAEVPDDDVDTLAAPAPCTLKKRAAAVLLYASPGKVETLRFLKDCPGEVIIGEKREPGPVGAMKSAAAKAAGGRTAFVVDRNGEKLRTLLNRPNGTERTAAYFRKKLKSGYDYIVIDEITAHPEFADGAGTNRRLRKLLQRLPRNTILPYISIDLTQQPAGFSAMKARRLLLRALKVRGRALALEVYLKTPSVIAGAAPANYRRAADRLALAVAGLKHGRGINRKAISVIGASVHGGSAELVQYRYLDQPSRDLTSIKKQVNAIRHGSRRLRSQKGLGYYFVFRADLMPFSTAPYSYDALIRRMRTQALRFK